jgi:enterochelin esterase family protein
MSLEKLAADLRARIGARKVPIVEEMRVTFLLDDATAERAFVIGDWTEWKPVPMARVANSKLWFRTETFPKGAVLEYKLISGTTIILDPANSAIASNGLGGSNSVLTMPDYRAETRIEPPAPEHRGRMETLEVESAILKNRRAIQVWLPAAYDRETSRRFPVLFLHDGPDYILRAKAPQIVDHLIAERRIPPLILVFVPPLDRMAEYWRRSSDYVRFAVEELVPTLDARYRTVSAPEARAVGGASLGGLISLRLAMARPDLFGSVLSQSGAFWVDGRAVEKEIAGGTGLRAKVWMDYGEYEPTIRDSNRSLAATLKARRVRHREQWRPAAHNWTAWRDRLADALEWLFRK